MTRPAAPAQPARRSRGRWRRRWYRAVVPFAVLALLAGVSLLARTLEEPSMRRAETLSPAGAGGDGSSQLAQLLADRGVRVDHVADIHEALAAGEAEDDAVVFIPKPTQFGAQFASVTRFLPGEHRVVMVAPNQRQLAFAGAQVARGPTRWATTDAAPGCTVPEAVAAGRAAALRSRYQLPDEPDRACYQGGLVHTELGFGSSTTDLYVVGSADPFRNSRIDEHGNATLAVELLSAYDRVIWADALPFELDFEWPEFPGFGRPDLPELPEVDAPERRDLDRTPGDGLGYLVSGYPAPVLVALALAALLALLVALVRARRLGPPVSEPLPVLVPAAEAVAGRGRLYQRARARGAALAALRSAAVARMTPALGLAAAPPPEPGTVVSAVAARTGLPDDHVRSVLYGPEPDTDEELTQAVAALDALVESVTREGGVP